MVPDDTLRELTTRVQQLEADLAAHRRRRWPRVPKHRIGTLLALIALLVTAPLALATDRFTDVPPGVHHDDVTKLASAGVTVGCVDVEGTPMFCPSQDVTREQMASFLVRGLPRIATGVWLNQATDPDATITVSIDTGIPLSASASTGFLKIDVSAAFTSSDSNQCLAALEGTLRQNGLHVAGIPGAFGPPTDDIAANGRETVTMLYVHEVGSGTYDLEIEASAFDSSLPCDAIVNGAVTVMYIPFDGDANNDTP
jgi:hypothetical protein